MRVSGRIIKWMGRASLTSGRVSCNIPVNGRMMSIMGGAFFTPILTQTPSGFPTKESSKMESNKVVDSSSLKTH